MSDAGEWRDERVRTFFFFSSSSFSCFGPVCIYQPKQLDFAGIAGMVSIFFGTKQKGYLYWFIGQYSIYWPVRYRINFLGSDLIHSYK